MKNALIFVLLACCLTTAAFAAPLTKADLELLAAESKVRVEAVDCDAGELLSEAVKKNPAIRLEVWFVGTCEEVVEVNRGNLTIRGFGEQSQLIGAVTLNGGTDYSLRDFYIRDSPESGIFVNQSRAVFIHGMSIQDPGFRGILLKDASATISDTVVNNSQTVGILNRSSNVTLAGTVESTNAAIAGFSATLAGTYFTDDDTRVIATNSLFGMIIQLNSSITFAEGTLEANNNDFIGLLVTGRATFAYGTALIEAKGNAIGVFVSEHSSFQPFVGFGATVDISENTDGGLFLLRDGILDMVADTGITGNGGPGLLVDEGSSMTMNGTTVEGNGADIVLTDNVVATFGEGNTIGTPIICDGNVVTRGTAACGTTGEGLGLSPVAQKAIHELRGAVDLR